GGCPPGWRAAHDRLQPLPRRHRAASGLLGPLAAPPPDPRPGRLACRRRPWGAAAPRPGPALWLVPRDRPPDRQRPPRRPAPPYPPPPPRTRPPPLPRPTPPGPNKALP